MDDDRTLLEVIGRDPADGLAWLALADSLEESGQPRRAELLRLTRRVMGMPFDHPARHAHEADVAALLVEGVCPCVPEIETSFGMRFVLVPPGVALMGLQPGSPDQQNDEQPRHPVELRQGIWLAKYPVTQAQYRAARRRSPSVFAEGGKNAARVKGLDTSRHPVDSVSWDDAVAFCEALNRRSAESRAGRTYRLPTEAEWELACRASGVVTTHFLFGDTLTSDVANFNGARPFAAPEGPNLERTCRVGTYPPNALGLFDLMGNVWEWVDDWFSRGEYARHRRVDPRGPEQGQARVLRGGSWSSYGWGCRIAYRNCIGPTAANDNFGLRAVLVMEGGA